MYICMFAIGRPIGLCLFDFHFGALMDDSVTPTVVSVGP